MKAFLHQLKLETVSRLKQIGKSPCCNAKPDRAPHIKIPRIGHFVFVFCWRCCGFLGGLFMLKPLVGTLALTTAIPLWLVMIAPMAVDGIRQYYFGKLSNNPRRAVTGLIAGLGSCVMLTSLHF